MSATRTYVYGRNKIERPASESIADVKAALAEIFPELANATYTESGDTVTFQVRAANKGAGTRTYVYGRNKIERPADESVEDVKAALAEIFPELANATYSAEGDTVTFQVRAANKGY